MGNERKKGKRRISFKRKKDRNRRGGDLSREKILVKKGREEFEKRREERLREPIRIDVRI